MVTGLEFLSVVRSKGGWYDDSRSTRTPMEKVCVVDVLRFTAEPAVP